MTIDLEVLIVSYASGAAIETCLASLGDALPDVPIAIREHAADPDELDRVRSLAARHAGPVRVTHDPSNPGFAAGCNALASASSATWLLFLNPDTEVLAWPWSDEQAPPLRHIVGPEMVDSGPDGEHHGVTYRVRDEIARSWLRRRGRAPDGRGFVSGAALLIEASTFAELDGFDEGYFLFYEDIDLCLRANDVGIRTVIDPRWRVRHARRHSTSDRFGDALVWSYESGCRFHGRRGSPVAGYRAYAAADAGARWVRHLAGRDRTRRRAYGALARRALSDLIRRGRSRP